MNEIYKVPLTWVCTGWVEIEAPSFDEAVEMYCDGKTGLGIHKNDDEHEGLDDDLIDLIHLGKMKYAPWDYTTQKSIFYK